MRKLIKMVQYKILFLESIFYIRSVDDLIYLKWNMYRS